MRRLPSAAQVAVLLGALAVFAWLAREFWTVLAIAALFIFAPAALALGVVSLGRFARRRRAR